MSFGPAPAWSFRIALCAALHGFGALPLHASEPSYYECVYPELSGVVEWPTILRFMLDTESRRGYRVDTPTARPVRIYRSATDITLLDFQKHHEISMVTIRHDGESVYSRHQLVRPRAEKERRVLPGPMGEQFFGRCLPAHETALGNP